MIYTKGYGMLGENMPDISDTDISSVLWTGDREFYQV